MALCMEGFYNKTLSKLEMAIKELEIDANNPLQQIETIISKIVSCLSEVKKYVLKEGFKDLEEEVYFFKYQKPVIVAKLIYYNTIYKIEAKKPFGGKQVMEACLNEKLVKLKRFSDGNIEFLKYYWTNSTYLDHKYFVRGQHDIKLSLDTIFFETDHRFSTSHDYKVAKIIANDRLQIYLEEQLNSNTKIEEGSESSPLNWTGSKTALTELIYALYSQGVFGNADIKVIAKTFENTFNISLGDFYHTFMELKSRKINRTKFLDSLRDTLIRKMDEEDEV